MFCSPIYDEYADEVDQISISDDVDLGSSQPIYDSYETDVEEPFYLGIEKQYHVGINIEDIRKETISSQDSSQLFSELQQHVHEQISEVDKENIEKQIEVKLFGFQAISFLYDLVAIYMESYFLEDFSPSIFRIKADNDCEYMLQIQILLQVMNSPLILVCIERSFVISSMLAWLHWKNDVT